MKGQFPDKRTVGIPPDFVTYLDKTKSYHDATKKLIKDATAAEEARIKAESARKAAEHDRVIAESNREGRFSALEVKTIGLEATIHARLDEIEAAYRAEVDQYEHALHVLGTLHPEVPYLALGNCLHFGTGKLTITNGMPVYHGATIVDGQLVLDDEITGIS